jgi:hypothetical protein
MAVTTSLHDWGAVEKKRALAAFSGEPGAIEGYRVGRGEKDGRGSEGGLSAGWLRQEGWGTAV